MNTNKRKNNFLKKAIEKFGDRFDYSKVEYINNKVNVIIICKRHGVFSQTPSSHLRGEHGCSFCAIEITAQQKTMTGAQFFERATNFHHNKYDYLFNDFLSLKNKITIICPIHGSFSQIAYIHLKSGCKECRDDKYRYTIQEFIEEANKVHDNLYNYSKIIDYINNKIKLEIICKNHGSFFIRGDRHLNGYGCSKCRKEKIVSSKLNDFLIKANKIHNGFYSYLKVAEKFISNNSKVIIICPEHGPWKQLAWQHLNGIKCKKCSYNIKKLTQEEFIGKCTEVHKGKYDYSEVIFSIVAKKVIIICPQHGKFSQSGASHLRGCGCPNCSRIISHMETKWLDHLNVPQNCRNISLKIGDKFFFPDGIDILNKIIYEFNGDYWHGNPRIYDPNKISKITKKTFGQMYQKTLEKENILKLAGYKVISIWESDWKKLNEQSQS